MAKVSKYGQWKYPGQDTIIPNANGSITMKGVPYPVLGIDDLGNQQIMIPGVDYQFPGNSVYEIPMMAVGGLVNPCPPGQVPDGQGGCIDDLSTPPIPSSSLYNYYMENLNKFKAQGLNNAEEIAGKMVKSRRTCKPGDECWEEPEIVKPPVVNDPNIQKVIFNTDKGDIYKVQDRKTKRLIRYEDFNGNVIDINNPSGTPANEFYDRGPNAQPGLMPGKEMKRIAIPSGGFKQGGDISIPSLKKVKIKSLPKAQLLGEISNWQKQLFNNVPTPGNLTNYTAKPATSKSLLSELTKENNSKFAVSESTNANPILPRHWTDEAGKPRTNSQIRAIETEWQRIHDAEVAAEKEKLRRENEEYKRKQQEFAKENFGVDVSQLDNFQKYDDGSWVPKTKSLKEFEQRAKEASLENLAERRIANKKTVGEELGQVAMELPFALIGTGAYRQAFNSLRGLNKTGKILGTVDNVFQPQALNLKPGSYDDELFAYLASMEDPNIDRAFLTGLPDDQNLFYQRFGQTLRQEPNVAPNQDRLRSWLEIDAAINNRLMTPPSELVITPQGIRETYTNPFQLDNLTINNTRRYGFMDSLFGTISDRVGALSRVRTPAQARTFMRNTFGFGNSSAKNTTRGVMNKSLLDKNQTKVLLKDKSEIDKLEKLSEAEFEDILITPDGKIKFPEKYNGPKQTTKIETKDWVDEFNDNLDLLNRIIAENNTSGREYWVTGITEDGVLKFRTADGRTSSMRTYINPGKFRGEIQDIADESYMVNEIPGLQMASASPIFGDAVRGTGTYKSLNEYLKTLDLGRVKSGMNVQSNYSRPLWENAIKKGDAFGFYASPGTVYGIMKKEGGDLPKAQDFGTVEEGLYKIAAYEKARGSRTGSGVSKYGNPRLKDNPTDKDAVDWMVANMLPIAKNYYTTPTEQVEAIDFIYNTGRDPRIYQLDQYLRSIGQPGLPNRGSYNIDYYGANPDSNAKTKLAELDKLWQQHGPAINKLSVNQRRQLLNKGRDFYYQNIEVKPDGSPSDAYYNTWYGRIWNTNDARPFDPKDSRFAPKRQEGGQQEDELSLLTNRNRAFQDIIVDDEVFEQGDFDLYLGQAQEGLPSDYDKFLAYSETAPENRRPDANWQYGNPRQYDHYGMWDALGKPENFDQALEMNPHWQPDPYDNMYHGFSTNPNTGVWLKSHIPGESHPGDTGWMEYKDFMLSNDPDWGGKNQNLVYDPELQRMRYINREQQGGLQKAQTTGLIEGINKMYGINQEPGLMDKLNSMMNPSTSKFNYARYRDAAAKYLGRGIFKGTPLTPDDIASAAQEFYNKTSYEYPLDLLLAQGQMESKLGKTLKSQHNYFNIGNTDEGAIKKFPSAKSSVLEYMNLMYNDYLDKGKKSPDDLLKPNGFVNYRGNRYASNPKYESDLAQQRAFIKKHIGL